MPSNSELFATLKVFLANAIWIGVAAVAVAVIFAYSPNDFETIVLGRILANSSIVNDWVATIGILVGGVFSYYRFFRGRTFVPIVNLKVSGEQNVVNGTVYLLVSANIENSGQTKVSLNTNLTGVTITGREPGQTDWAPIDGETAHNKIPDVIEPGQSVGMHFDSIFDKGAIEALKIDFTVVPEPSRTGKQKDPWLTSQTILLVPEDT